MSTPSAASCNLHSLVRAGCNSVCLLCFCSRKCVSRFVRHVWIQGRRSALSLGVGVVVTSDPKFSAIPHRHACVLLAPAFIIVISTMTRCWNRVQRTFAHVLASRTVSRDVCSRPLLRTLGFPSSWAARRRHRMPRSCRVGLSCCSITACRFKGLPVSVFHQWAWAAPTSKCCDLHEDRCLRNLHSALHLFVRGGLSSGVSPIRHADEGLRDSGKQRC